MSSIALRLKRLEQSPALVQPCRVCNGRGRHVVSYIHEGDPEPEVEGCRECGEVYHIVVRYVKAKAIKDRYLNN